MRNLSATVSYRAQRGVILFIALIVLVAMSLAGIALMRSVDTNVMIAGNLAFRQGGTLAADRAFEDPAAGAIAWLRSASNATLMSNQAVPYYRPTWEPGVNMLTNFDWSSVTPIADNNSGNTIRYAIHRMCETAMDQNAANANCVRVASADTAGPRGAQDYNNLALTGASATYYRVTVRVEGPRNTVSYVQAMLN